MRTVVLHGALGKRFGDHFTLDIASPAEALRALVVMVKGFREHLRDGHYRVIRGDRRKGHALDIEECKAGLGSAQEFHIVPIVAGAAGGLGKILAGVALIALAVFLPVAAFGIGIGTMTIGSIATTIGISLILGGVATMLTRAPALQGGSAAVDRKDSFLFGGQINVARQGGPVPSVYGRFEVGSVVISAGLETQQLLSPAPPTLDVQTVLRMKLSGQLH